MNVVLIYNQKSGGRFTLKQIKRLFKDNGLEVSYSFTMQQLTSRKLANLLKKGVTVAAIGGDGTMNAVARHIVGTKSKLLPLPGGTLNHFVRDLGMTGSVEDVLKQVSTAEEQLIDVGYVNDELFVNNSSLGLYPFTLIDRKSANKWLSKWVAATHAAINQLIRFRRLPFVIDGEKIRSPFVFVGNNHYDIAASLIPQRNSLKKGMLTVMVATSSSRFSLIRAAFATLKGDVSGIDDFKLQERKELTVYSPRVTTPVSFDGEVKRLSFPLEYKVASKVLTVLVVKND